MTAATSNDLDFPDVNLNIEQNNNTPDAVNANLYPKIATNVSSQTNKAASVASVTSEEDKDLSPVPGIRKATSPALFHLALAAPEPATAVSGIAIKSMTDEMATPRNESAEKTAEVSSCEWMQ